MGRKIYKVPTTELFRVELEGTFASSAEVQNPDDTNGRIDGQDVNADFGDWDNTFGNSTWAGESN